MKASGTGAGIWAKLQSSGTSIGAQDARQSKEDPNGDDGSGMAWVRKRKEQKKLQEEEEEERRLRDVQKEKETTSGAATPVAHGGESATSTPTTEHVTTAVTVPAPHHHHHHNHHHPHSHKRVPSVPERHESGDTVRGVPLGLGPLLPAIQAHAQDKEASETTPVGGRMRSESNASNASGSEADLEDSEDSPKDTENDAEDELELDEDEDEVKVRWCPFSLLALNTCWTRANVTLV